MRFYDLHHVDGFPQKGDNGTNLVGARCDLRKRFYGIDKGTLVQIVQRHGEK